VEAVPLSLLQLADQKEKRSIRPGMAEEIYGGHVLYGGMIQSGGTLQIETIFTTTTRFADLRLVSRFGRRLKEGRLRISCWFRAGDEIIANVRLLYAGEAIDGLGFGRMACTTRNDVLTTAGRGHREACFALLLRAERPIRLVAPGAPRGPAANDRLLIFAVNSYGDLIPPFAGPADPAWLREMIGEKK